MASLTSVYFYDSLQAMLMRTFCKTCIWQLVFVVLMIQRSRGWKQGSCEAGTRGVLWGRQKVVDKAFIDHEKTLLLLMLHASATTFENAAGSSNFSVRFTVTRKKYIKHCRQQEIQLLRACSTSAPTGKA